MKPRSPAAGIDSAHTVCVKKPKTSGGFVARFTHLLIKTQPDAGVDFLLCFLTTSHWTSAAVFLGFFVYWLLSRDRHLMPLAHSFVSPPPRGNMVGGFWQWMVAGVRMHYCYWAPAAHIKRQRQKRSIYSFVGVPLPLFIFLFWDGES